MPSWLQQRQSLKRNTENKIYATLADKNYAPAPERKRGGQADDSDCLQGTCWKLIC